MSASLPSLVLLSILALPGLPWIRHGEAKTPPLAAAVDGAAPAAAAAAAPAAKHDRVVVLAAASPEYLGLAVRPSVRTLPDAATRLLVFRGGLCVLDRGLREVSREGGSSPDGRIVVQQSGITERGAAADDGSAGIVVTTRYDSQVDVTPGTSSTDGDVVRGSTVLTWVDPASPDGRWQLTLEDGRWVKDVSVLPGRGGVVLTSFVPRHGPTDFRVLDAAGRELLHVPETRGETVGIATTAGFAAADVKFKDSMGLAERGVVVFDLAKGTNWTYAWRYGSDEEPLSWTLREGGELLVRLASGTRRFDSTGRRR